MSIIPWRTGVNMREFAYYDRPECLRFPQAIPPTREAQLAALQDLQVPLVRFFAVHRAVDLDTNLAQVGTALDLFRQKGMQTIVCIGDSLGASGHTIPGDDEFHRDTPLGHFHKRYWKERHYETHYLPYVERLVDQFGDHPAVLIWELGNELALHPRPRPEDPSIEPVTRQDFDQFIEFVATASRAIKVRSPRKLVSTGIINTNQIAPDGSSDEQRVQCARQLYGLPDIDLISIHEYSTERDEDFALDDRLAMIDVNVALNDMQKPFYVGELGAELTFTPDRPRFIRERVKTWKERGAFSVLLWAFDVSEHDSGMADTLAFAKRHPDFEVLKEIVQEFAGAIAPVFFDAAMRFGGDSGQARESQQSLIIEPTSRFTKLFRVVSGDGVKIRSSPTRQAQDLGLLEFGAVVQVDPDTRDEADEHIWWEHDGGWSAERPQVGDEVFLTAMMPVESGQRTRERPETIPAARFTKRYQVVTSKLNIRSDHDEHSDNRGSLANGAIIIVDPASRFEGDAFIWLEHEQGWSAECPLDRSELFLFEEVEEDEIPEAFSLPPLQFPLSDDEPLNVNTLKLRDRLFQRLPVDRELVRVLQHFGNTRFAFNRGFQTPPPPGKGLYDRFFQGLHPGIDFGNRDNDQLIPVVSGISGQHIPKVVRIIRDSYRPVGVRVKAGPYDIIYGHLRDDEDLVPDGTILTADSLIGNIATRADIAAFDAAHPENPLGFAPHLHFEIRFAFGSETTILNPLLFFPHSVRETVAHHPPSAQEMFAYQQHFYIEPTKSPSWTKWGDPFAQPVIRKDQSLIGPRSGLGNG